MRTKWWTLYNVLKKDLKPIIQSISLKGREFMGGFLVADLYADTWVRCYFDSEDDLSESLSILLRKGMVLRKVIGKRSVLVLGEWRFLKGPVRYKEILYQEMFHDNPPPQGLGDKKEQLLQRYTAQHKLLIEEAFKGFASTRRRTRKVAESILVNQLERWSKFSVEVVVEGLSIYVNRNLAADGYAEDYCFGIIRKLSEKPEFVENKPKVSIGQEALVRARKESEERRVEEEQPEIHGDVYGNR